MKKLLLIFLLLTPYFSRADHGAGVDIFYTHLHDSTYSISLIIYGNCTDRTDYLKLFQLSPQIDVFENSVKKATMALSLVPDSTRDASPYCKKQVDSTSCINPTSPIQGFTRIFYSDTIRLPYRSANWLFRFNGALNTGCQSRLGRPGALSNYTTNPAGGSNNMTVDATLNNLQGDNSSPFSFFSNIPLYCVNVPGVFTQQSTDPNGDSLVYEVVTPRNMASGNCLFPGPATGYLVLRTGFNPLHVVPASYGFNNRTGRVVFTPDISQISIIAMKISEYRNGVLVGSVERERILKILGTCNNLPPTSHIDTSAITLRGATVIGLDTLITCPGSLINLKIPVSNPYGDTVKASVENLLSGSNITITNNNTTAPAVSFSWNTFGVPNGTYTFSIRYVTNSCPLPSTSLATYTIVVAGAGYVVIKQQNLTNCVRKAIVQYTLSDGRPPYTLTISQAGNVVNSYTTSNTVIDSLEPGNYHFKLMSSGFDCALESDFGIRDSGDYPYPPVVKSPVDYCRNFENPLALSAQADNLATLRWYDLNQVYTTTAPTPSTKAGGTYVYTVTQKYKTCESAPDSIYVHISQDECNYEPNIYNVITPNGDGKNDKWIISNLEYYPSAVVQLYNKLGDKVYERTNYQSDFDGAQLPSGVYYYLLRLNGTNKNTGTELYKGYLMIKR